MRGDRCFLSPFPLLQSLAEAARAAELKQIESRIQTLHPSVSKGSGDKEQDSAKELHAFESTRHEDARARCLAEALAARQGQLRLSLERLSSRLLSLGTEVEESRYSAHLQTMASSSQQN